MTLNISLVSRWGIHQSSDFRLVDVDQRSLVSDHSPKLFQLAYQDWVGNVTYCGIGRWHGSDTSDWLKEWLSHQFGEQRTYEDVLEVICEQGSSWLRDIYHFTKRDFSHTFVLTSFLDGNPVISLVSNYQRLDTPELASPSPNLQVSTVVVNRRRLVITGIPAAVSNEDADMLESFGRPSVDTHDIQKAFARVNAISSNSPKAQDSIGESCWVYSILPDGSSRGRLFGSVEGELMPILLINGMALQDQIQLNAAPGREIQMTSSTFVTSESLNQRENVECQPRIIQAHSMNVEKASITDVGWLGGSTSRVQAVNMYGVATGESWLSPSGPSHAFLWDKESILDLGTLGGGSSHGKDINDHAEIVGSSHAESGSNRAFLWSKERGFLDLGTLGGWNSHASAINNSSVVVGSSWTTPGQHPADPEERAFIWNAQEGMRSIGSLEGSWSRAHDVNEKGHVVGISPVGGFSHGFFYSGDGELIDIGTLGGNSCRPEAVNAKGQVVGMSEDSTSINRPFVWSLEAGMRPLPIPNALIVRDIDDVGNVIGDCDTDVGKRSFIYSERLGLRLLPWYEHHRSEALGNANAGFICGQFVGIEMHCHGVIWRVSLD
jgi:probable HAF family extracellular repeat protein